LLYQGTDGDEAERKKSEKLDGELVKERLTFLQPNNLLLISSQNRSSYDLAKAIHLKMTSVDYFQCDEEIMQVKGFLDDHGTLEILSFSKEPKTKRSKLMLQAIQPTVFVFMMTISGDVPIYINEQLKHLQLLCQQLGGVESCGSALVISGTGTLREYLLSNTIPEFEALADVDDVIDAIYSKFEMALSEFQESRLFLVEDDVENIVLPQLHDMFHSSISDKKSEYQEQKKNDKKKTDTVDQATPSILALAIVVAMAGFLIFNVYFN